MVSASKKVEVKLDLLTDIEMLLMVQKALRSEKCHHILQYVKTNNIYIWRIMIKIKNDNILSIGI